MQPQSPQQQGSTLSTSGTPALPPLQAQPLPPTPQSNSVHGSTTPTAVPPVGNPELADDGDLIEKEWVAKVKHIMTSTAHDPYVQSQQFSQLKADYMQKRYGKHIKSSD